MAARIAIGSADFIKEVKEQLQQQRKQSRALKKTPFFKVLFILAAVFLVVVVIILRFYYMERYQLNERLKEERGRTRGLIFQEKEKIRKDLSEKYRADKVSFEAMKKRLDIEKKERLKLQKQAR